MTAFSYTLTHQIEKNIRTMFGRLAIVTRKSISHESFLNLFVPAHQREMFRTMANLSETGTGRRANYDWEGTGLLFRIYQKVNLRAPPIPRLMFLQEDAPEDLVADITRWATTGGNASGDFGRVLALFKALNEDLTRSQMRHVWPSIVPICDADPTNHQLKEVAKEVQDMRPAAFPPALPHGLVQACRKTAATIAMTSLIPHDVEAPEHGEVDITAVEGARYEERDLEYIGLLQ